MTTKLAKIKRNNKKRNKLVKQGVIKNKANKQNKPAKQPIPKIIKPAKETESEESDDGEDMLQMVEDEDLDFIKTAIANRSYNIYNKVKLTGNTTLKPKKRKLQEDESLEQNYENELAGEDKVAYKALLPIKTSKGIVPQKMVVDQRVDVETNVENETDTNAQGEDTDEEAAEDEYVFQDSLFDPNVPLSEAQLLARRNETIRQQKITIGSLSAQLLENPEEKVSNFRILLSMMDDNDANVYLTGRKLVLVSLLEVFKDLLPSYEIKNIISDGVKLKKDTFKLHKYEENLLAYYKRYLQKLEKYCFTIRKKRGDGRKRSEEENKLAELAVQAMCDLLISHPYFNYAKNIAQAIVPFLNHSNRHVREMVKNTVKTVFKEDKKEEITLQILRVINHYLKNHAHNVNTEMLEVLLVLNLRDINLDHEKESDIKQKKLKAQKHKLLQMSKKERKRKKKLQMVEKEMIETKAEENKQQKMLRLTEITKIVFNIYFRILKNSSNTKVLGVCLEGLAKFAHCINLDFYMDLVNVLDKLLKEDWIGYREQLHCIQTVFSVLSGVGEALTLDPTRFYTALYKDMLTNTASKHHDNILVLLTTLTEALVKRKKKITNKRTVGFVKRLATLSLQLLHNGSLGCLGLMKNIMQLNRGVDILLDFDNSTGEGKFQVELDDPEYANASETAIYEMITLTKHYHPVVSKYAKHIASGVPTTGEGSIQMIYGKCTPEQLFTDFSMNEMAFNPPVPPPKQVQPKTGIKRVRFADSRFEADCKDTIRRQMKRCKFCTE